MNGIRLTKHHSTACWACHIESFSDDLKTEIRSRLASICHGENHADTSSKIYSYKETLKEFLSRYNTKSAETQKGMIGELLSHIILLTEFSRYKSVCPFFNMEEASIKKGFDLILFDKVTKNVWITEVKSGEAGNVESDKKNTSLLNIAKNDLKVRLNAQDRKIWLNALNGAQIALKKGKVKNQINAILSSLTDEVVDGKPSSANKDVILISVLFNPLHTRISVDKVGDKRASIIKEKLFADLIVLSIQKSTYQKVVTFLKSEAKG